MPLWECDSQTPSLVAPPLPLTCRTNSSVPSAKTVSATTAWLVFAPVARAACWGSNVFVFNRLFTTRSRVFDTGEERYKQQRTRCILTNPTMEKSKMPTHELQRTRLIDGVSGCGVQSNESSRFCALWFLFRPPHSDSRRVQAEPEVELCALRRSPPLLRRQVAPSNLSFTQGK